MKPKFFIDLHTHTKISDGVHPPQELIDKARAAGIRVLAITDHNATVPDLAELRQANPDMILLAGSEISCRYETLEGREVELHIVGLMIDPQEESMARVLRTNQPDRRPYINAILDKLRVHGIDLGSYEELKARFPDAGFLGRMAIAVDMVNHGYVKDVDEAFDIYLGGAPDQKGLAYVPSQLQYVTLEEAVTAIERTGIAVLAHLWYYNLPEAENHRLLARFRELGGTAMEVEYRRYSRAQRDALAALAKQYGLRPSAGSDYHGQDASDSLDNCFPMEILEELLR